MDFIFQQKDVDGLPDLVKENNHPSIIACGKSQKELTHFYIDVEKHLINVSTWIIIIFECV